jgi:hypothetical protein
VISNRKSAYTPLFNRHKEIAIKPITDDGASLENGLELSFLTRRMDASEVAAIPESRGLASAVAVTGVFLMAGVMAYLEGQLPVTCLGSIGLTLAIPFLLVIPVVVILAKKPSHH